MRGQGPDRQARKSTQGEGWVIAHSSPRLLFRVLNTHMDDVTALGAGSVIEEGDGKLPGLNLTLKMPIVRRA